MYLHVALVQLSYLDSAFKILFIADLVSGPKNPVAGIANALWKRINAARVLRPNTVVSFPTEPLPEGETVYPNVLRTL